MKQRKLSRHHDALSIPFYGRRGKALRVNVVLEGEDDRILGGLESTLSDGLNHILQHIKTTRTLLFSCHRRCESAGRRLWQCSEQKQQDMTQT